MLITTSIHLIEATSNPNSTLQVFWMYREENSRCPLRRQNAGLFACPGSLSFVDLGRLHHVTAI
jgi:hypothetical protein